MCLYFLFQGYNANVQKPCFTIFQGVFRKSYAQSLSLRPLKEILFLFSNRICCMALFVLQWKRKHSCMSLTVKVLSFTLVNKEGDLWQFMACGMAHSAKKKKKMELLSCYTPAASSMASCVILNVQACKWETRQEIKQIEEYRQFGAKPAWNFGQENICLSGYTGLEQLKIYRFEQMLLHFVWC